MYVKHIPRYTGFGLGQEQPTVLLPSSPTVAATTPMTAPLVAFGQPISWNTIIVGAGVLALAWLAFSGTRKARLYIRGAFI